jgi:hypothetical protein
MIGECSGVCRCSGEFRIEGVQGRVGEFRMCKGILEELMGGYGGSFSDTRGVDRSFRQLTVARGVRGDIRGRRGSLRKFSGVKVSSGNFG